MIIRRFTVSLELAWKFRDVPVNGRDDSHGDFRNKIMQGETEQGDPVGARRETIAALAALRSGYGRVGTHRAMFNELGFVPTAQGNPRAT